MGDPRHRFPVQRPLISAEEERAREEAAGWLILLDEDSADETRHREFRAWLVARPENEAAWTSVSATGALLAGAKKAERDPPLPAGSAWTRLVRWPYAIAALLIVCLAAAIAPGVALRLQADHATGTAQIDSFQLDDGSTVRLGPDSALRLAFSAGERRVTLLSGEALFDVKPDAMRPFRVVTRDATTTVLGTRFDVAALAGGTSVAVAHGHVRVATAAGGATVDLHAGDWLRVGVDAAVETGSGLPDHMTAGPGPRLAVRNRPVAEVIERLRPWFAGRIVIADDAMGRQPVTGVFDAADPVSALEIIVGPQGGRVMRVTPWLLIVVGN